MKKSLLGCAILTAVAAMPVQADTILGAYVGAQGWNMGVEGGFATEQSLTEFSFDDKTNSSIYVALEHPIPLVPNIKLVRTSMDTSGVTSLDAQFEFNDQLYPVNTTVETDFEMSATDLILYYEILDNDLITIDIGVNGKYVDGTIMVAEADGGNAVSTDFSGIIPMAYAKTAIGLPFTGLGVYAEGSFLAVGDHSVSDVQAGVTFSFVETLALDLTIQAGYRAMNVELDDLDDIYSNLDFTGVFVGLEFDF